MEMYFKGVGAGYVLKGDKVPEGKGELDEQLVSVLFFQIDEQHQYLVEGISTLYEAWKKLQSHFNVSTMPRRIAARQDFFNVYHDPALPIDAYLHKVDAAVKALVTLNCKVEEVEILDVLLMNLDSSYDAVRTTILTQREEPNLQQVKSILLGAARSAVTVKSEPSDVALAAQGFRRGGGRGHSGSGGGHHRSDSGSPERRAPSRDDKGYRWCDPTKEGHCHRCGRSGHIAARCIHDMPQHVKDWVMLGAPHTGASAVEDEAAGIAHGLSSVSITPCSRSRRSRSSSSSPPDDRAILFI